MAAASERVNEKGMRNASRAAGSGRSMTAPGIGREHQAELDELARNFVQGRDGMALSAAWDQRVDREAREKETELVRARAEERERRGLPPEPERDRERHLGGARVGAGEISSFSAWRNRNSVLTTMALFARVCGQHHHPEH